MARCFVENMVLDKQAGKKSPLYIQICDSFKSALSDQKIVKGQVLPSVYELAQEWNVNYRTAKTAFDMLAEEGFVSYMPNKDVVVMGDSEAKQGVSYVCCQRDAYFEVISEGVNCFIEQNKLDYRFIDASHSPKCFLEAVTSPGKDVGGILISPWELQGYKEAVEEAINFGIKVVFVNRTIPGVEASSVTEDHYGAAFKVTQHLLSKHGLPVYYVGYTDQPDSCREWVNGWKIAMMHFGYCDTKDYLFGLSVPGDKVAQTHDFCLEADIEAAIKVFEACENGTCSIFAGNPYIARGIYIVADKLGMKIGRDVFVASIGDIPLAKTFSVPLTVVNIFPELVGFQSAKLLHEMMTGVVNGPIQVRIPCKLIERESSLGVS